LEKIAHLFKNDPNVSLLSDFLFFIFLGTVIPCALNRLLSLADLKPEVKLTGIASELRKHHQLTHLYFQKRAHFQLHTRLFNSLIMSVSEKEKKNIF
jgi:hypothetical protein